MADVQEEPTPAPKEKKKKKSSSVKSNKSATEEAPQLNASEGGEPTGDAPAPAELPPLEAPAPDSDAAAAQEQPQEGAEEPASGEAPAPPDAEAPKADPVPEQPAVPQMTAKQRREEEVALAKENKMREIAEGFFLVDYNKDGLIDKSDLQMTFNVLGMAPLSDEAFDTMLSEAPSPLDVDAFIALVGSSKMELDPEEILVQALSSWDMTDSGYVPEERIRRDLMEWGQVFTEEEVNAALEDAPIYNEKEGPMIDYVEFCKILSGRA